MQPGLTEPTFHQQMAKRVVGQHHCEICNESFVHHSKLERHFASVGHKRFEKLLELTRQASPSSSSSTICGSPSHHSRLDTDHVQGDTDSEPNNTECFSDEEMCSEKMDETTCSSSEDDDDNEDEDLAVDSAEVSCVPFDIADVLATTQSYSDFSPFPTKIHALLYILMNGPHRVSESILKFIWFIFGQLSSNVPSLMQIKCFQLPGILLPEKHYTDKGIPFYVRRPAHILRLCLGSPSIARKLRRLPVVSNSSIRELYHGKIWHYNKCFQAQMVEYKKTVFYVEDIVQFQHPHFGVTYGKIVRFFQLESTDEPQVTLQCLLNLSQFVCANQHVNTMYCDPSAVVLSGTISVPISGICGPPPNPFPIILEYCERSGILSRMAAEDFSKFTSLSDFRSSSLLTLVCPLIIYTDDTSGNISKKWNKFDYWCLLLAGLPRHENAKFSNIHFIACSNQASCMELSPPIVGDLLLLEDRGITVYDAFLKRQVKVFAPVISFICDNPRASELVNHMGSAANKFCRMCLADRDTSPDQVGELRCKESSLKLISDIRELETEKAKVNARKNCGLRETPNSLFSLSCDLYKSTPFESLHTVLLGPCKYLLGLFISSLSSKQKIELLARLQAFDHSGIQGKVIGNITRNYKSFVGRDFKAWMQVAIFLVHPYLSAERVRVWLCLSKVFQITYVFPFCSGDEYKCRCICEDFLEAIRQTYPEMLRKPKVHMFLHLVDNMLDFGPTSSYNTERCESFNSVLRAYNVYGNRHAPSKDIAKRFAVLEYLRFIMDGGSLDQPASPSGNGLQQLYQLTAVQTYLNQVPAKDQEKNKSIYQPGTLRLKEKVRYHQQSLGNVPVFGRGIESTCISGLLPTSLTLPPSVTLSDTVTCTYKGVFTTKGDIAHRGSFVKLVQDGEVHYIYGMLLNCIKTTFNTYCLLQNMEDMGGVTNEFDCPLYTMPTTFRLVPSSLVTCAVSFVHECSSGCKFENSTPLVRVEREPVSVDRSVFVHDYGCNLYCLNVYCMNQ